MVLTAKRIVTRSVELREGLVLPGCGERLGPGRYDLRLIVERNDIDGEEVIVAGDVTNVAHLRYVRLLQEDMDALARDARVKVSREAGGEA